MAITASETRRNLFPLIEQVNDSRAWLERNVVNARNISSNADPHRRHRGASSHPARLDRLHPLAHRRPKQRQTHEPAHRRCVARPVQRDRQTQQLRHALSGAWSRRITQEHRLVYLVDDYWLIDERATHDTASDLEANTAALFR
jgi:hypothetical protein